MPDFRLDRLSAAFPVVGPDGKPLQSFQRLFTVVEEKIEAAFDELSQQVTDLAAVVASVQAAQAAADAAQAGANAAQADATAGTRETARLMSYPNPGSVLSAADVGTDCTISIAAHTRVYPVQASIDVPDVAIAAGTITGQPFSTRVYVYYDDATLALAAPTFLAATSSATAQVGAADGRHFVGYVDTPADGGTATTGTGGAPPGGGEIP